MLAKISKNIDAETGIKKKQEVRIQRNNRKRVTYD
jgi:hypothetical protein